MNENPFEALISLWISHYLFKETCENGSATGWELYEVTNGKLGDPNGIEPIKYKDLQIDESCNFTKEELIKNLILFRNGIKPES